MGAYDCRITKTPTASTVLRALDASGTVAADHVLDLGDRLELTLTEDEIAALEGAGLVVERGPALATRDARTDVGSGDGIDLVTGFVSGYMDAVQVDARVTTLAATYPTRCTIIDLPFQTSGYDGSLATAVGPTAVRALRITTTPAVRTNPGLLVIGGTHAREWMNPLIALEFAQQLLANEDPTSVDPATVAVTRIVTEGDVLIVPVMNPDGLTYSIHDDAGWRKNRRPNAGSPSCPGVDDNRNHEVYFGGAGSSAAVCAESYRGPAVFSEADTRNIRWLVEEFPNILVGVDLHSFGQQLLRPGPAGGTYISSLPVSAADHAIYTSLEATLGAAITAVNGAVYTTGTTSNHAGTSDEYLFFAHRVFGFNTECGTSFQPPWSTAVPVIAEVVAGLRALGVATLDLTTTTPTPLRVVQCIDRTGSMVAFGYDGSARSNAKRFADLLSLGDSTAVVSFADPSFDPTVTPVANRSRIEIPLTLLDDPGDVVAVRGAIDGIVFGGWTPIGAGLLRSASLLAGAPDPRAVLLISDGFENRDPSVASVLASWPAGLRVFTIALGPAADAVLLQSIATGTGGVFQASPTALDLHAIHNQMRADMSTDELVLNRTVAAAQDTDAHDVDVEVGADRLTVTVSGEGVVKREVALVAPSGRAVRATDLGVRDVAGDSYRLVAVDRPPPGRWRLLVTGRPAPYVAGAFVTSPLRTRVRLPTWRGEGPLAIEVEASFDGDPVGPVRVLGRTVTIPRLKRPIELERGVEEPSKEVLQTVGLLVRRRRVARRSSVWQGGAVTIGRGVSRLELQIEGRLRGGAPFKRVVTRTVIA
ncbi:MAG TPA: M14 family zinc carboxypeptidase [Thermoleophilaceae bacterium]|nr:M14 family zinc carboxypeptidase [Thermoleophilaceae bacterium]